MRPSVLVPGRVFQIFGRVFETQTQTQMSKSATVLPFRDDLRKRRL